MIHQKISEYSSKLEAMLAESKATITVEETIDKPLEQAMLEIISNGATSETDKDAGIQRLGAVQEWVKRGMRGEITLLQANEMILAIAERLNWGGSSDVSEELRPVYQALYGNLKNAIRAALPKAQNLHDRLTNLYAAKCEMDGTLQGTKEMAQTAR